jgi:hypothetical protein
MIRRPPTSIAVQQSEVEELKAERIDTHNRPAEQYGGSTVGDVKRERSATGAEEQEQESQFTETSIGDTR